MKRLVALSLLAVLTLAEPAAAKKADKVPDGTVSQIQDDRIRESSGLALSTQHDDLVYTINDRGNRPMIYAIQLSTGAVVGTTTLSGFDLEDTESIAVDADGTLWLGDLGDNDHERENVSIVSFPEPGPGDHDVTTANRYGVELPDGPFDVEGMLVHPDNGQVFLVSKDRGGLGTVYRLPAMTPGATITAEDLDVDAPQAVTDATFTHSGQHALFRTEDAVWVYDAAKWEPLSRVDTPQLKQGESITVERGDQSILLGSEGKNSPIVRVALPDQPADAAPIRLDDEADRPSSRLAIIGLVAATAFLGLATMLRRRLQRISY
jgi:hypothetical protein